MSSPRPLARRLACATLAAVVLLPVTGADAARRCPSGDLRYPFEPGGAKTFGVFALRIDGGGCATAHRIAKRWMDRFEANLADGRVKLPGSVHGWAFEELPPKAAQTYRLRGRKTGRTIRFHYVVPNG
jgi:hypothetical protein